MFLGFLGVWPSAEAVGPVTILKSNLDLEAKNHTKVSPLVLLQIFLWICLPLWHVLGSHDHSCQMLSGLTLLPLRPVAFVCYRRQPVPWVRRCCAPAALGTAMQTSAAAGERGLARFAEAAHSWCERIFWIQFLGFTLRHHLSPIICPHQSELGRPHRPPSQTNVGADCRAAKPLQSKFCICLSFNHWLLLDSSWIWKRQPGMSTWQDILKPNSYHIPHLLQRIAFEAFQLTRRGIILLYIYIYTLVSVSMA